MAGHLRSPRPADGSPISASRGRGAATGTSRVTTQSAGRALSGPSRTAIRRAAWPAPCNPNTPGGPGRALSACARCRIRRSRSAAPRVSSPFTGPKRIVRRAAAAVCWRVTQGLPQAGAIRRTSRAGLAAPKMRAAAGLHGDTAARPPAEDGPPLARPGFWRKTPWPEAEAPWARIAAGDRPSPTAVISDRTDLPRGTAQTNPRTQSPSGGKAKTLRAMRTPCVCHLQASGGDRAAAGPKQVPVGRHDCSG